MEEAWEPAALKASVTNEPKPRGLRKIMFNETALASRGLALENVELRFDLTESELSVEDKLDYAVDAYVRSEGNTFRYAASAFAPILLLMSTLQFYDEVDDLPTDLLITGSVCLLGFAGFYFAAYNTLLIIFRRILLEGLQMRLLLETEWDVFPSRWWKKVNLLAFASLLLGYLGLFVVLLRRLWA